MRFFFTACSRRSQGPPAAARRLGWGDMGEGGAETAAPIVAISILHALSLIFTAILSLIHI